MGQLHQTNESVWVSTSDDTSYPPLSGDAQYDAAVVGGGITGLTTALLLKRRGLKVAMVESDRIASGVTGYTTAKLTSLHRLIYARLTKSFGEETARLYGSANEDGLALIRELVGELDIECELKTRSAFTYTTSKDLVSEIEQEVEAARTAGLQATFVNQTELPYSTEAAVMLSDQASFHPRKYCLGLARAIEGDGSRVFEMTRALNVQATGDVLLETDRGTIRSPHLVIATQIPFFDRGLFFSRTYPERSYAIAVTLEDESPEGMYISVEKPTRSIRPLPAPSRPALVIGGEEHRTGEEPDTTARYVTLEKWARKHFKVVEIINRWSAQDYMSSDGLPFVGPAGPGYRNVLIATGFRKWGLTNGTAAAMVMADDIAGKQNDYAKLYYSLRVDPLQSAAEFAKANAVTASHYLLDHLHRIAAPSSEGLSKGQGGVVKHEGRIVAAYRGESGEVTAVSAICSHLGCVVSFNTAEKTWDCPCHGSRFNTEGRVISGPAKRDLRKLI